VNFPYKQQIIRASFWTCVTILFAAPIEVFHSLFEFFHLLFEWTEVSLDFIIELLFDTSMHKTQIVVFYIIIAGIIYGIYWLWKKSPAFYTRQKKSLHSFLSDEIESIQVYWQESAINKLKLFCAASVLIFLLFI
jgi:hypothetical protein